MMYSLVLGKYVLEGLYLTLSSLGQGYHQGVPASPYLVWSAGLDINLLESKLTTIARVLTISIIQYFSKSN